MITEKKRFSSNLPFKAKFSFRKSNWYLFPQGWSHTGNVMRQEYLSLSEQAGTNPEMSVSFKENLYKQMQYNIVEQYNITWLFINIVLTVNLHKVRETNVMQVPYRTEPVPTSKIA